MLISRLYTAFTRDLKVLRSIDLNRFKALSILMSIDIAPKHCFSVQCTTPRKSASNDWFILICNWNWFVALLVRSVSGHFFRSERVRRSNASKLFMRENKSSPKNFDKCENSYEKNDNALRHCSEVFRIISYEGCRQNYKNK